MCAPLWFARACLRTTLPNDASQLRDALNLRGVPWLLAAIALRPGSCLVAPGCEGVLPASFVVDLEDEQEFRALVCCGSVGGEWMGTILWQGAASLDVQMLKDLQLLPERFRKWAAAQTTKCDGILC